MRLTRRGVAVLVVAVPLLAFGLWGGYPLLRALGAVLLGAVLAAVLLTIRRLRVEVRRSVYPDRVERGAPALASLRVRNPGGGRRAGFLATDVAGSTIRTVRFRALGPGAEAVRHYELPTGTRGRLTVGPLVLHRADPFGLAHGELRAGGTATLWVHPRQLPARAPVAGYPRHHHDGPSTDGALRGSVDLLDVREYLPGDEVRHLHWKATARTGRLMVRDLADPEQPRFTLLLDTRSEALTAERFEEAVDLAASLLGVSARAGQHTRLVTSSGLDLPTPGGAPAVRRLLDELCELRRDDGRHPDLVPESLVGGGPIGGYLVVVTAGKTPPAALARLRQRFSTIAVFVLAGTDARTDPVTGARVLRADSAEEAILRWNEIIG
ncbi:DUF58 domain-containing protein [Plantactinospora solaniradicis]|uniref:DUF58 domain-containing protein n=1 Tax=Plantactinospora solaniradicis TaxID=1723736 RepID=A0ABW1KM48_9ACTN